VTSTQGRARRAILFAGGEAPPALGTIPELFPGEQSPLIVCADAGLVHCLDAGLVPHRLVGDFDSVPSALLQRATAAGAQRRQHPRDKDASDLALALLGLCEDGPEAVTVLGVSGGRTDHLLFNWLLPAWRDWPFTLRLVDGSSDARVATSAHAVDFACEPNALVSLLPLSRVEGITTGGLRYALRDRSMLPGDTLGLSNVATGEPVRVRVSSGTLLVVRVR